VLVDGVAGEAVVAWVATSGRATVERDIRPPESSAFTGFNGRAAGKVPGSAGHPDREKVL
jgi:hypothetical protein